MQRYLAALAITGLAVLGQAHGADCSGLKSLQLQYTEITSVKLLPAGPYTPPDSTTPIAGGDLPAMCEVQATIRPTADSAIEILVWLPTAWNGKYQQLGNNGFGGVFKYADMAENIRRSYAVASTNTGHRSVGFDISWAFPHPEKVTDMVWRGVHELTLKAKQVIAAYYGKPARYSYWNGCSTGGREGLMQAQRFPDEWDGIIAGGALAYWTRVATQELFLSIQLGNAKISNAQLTAVNKAVIQACDANDGVVGDGLIGDPRRCDWSPTALVCKPGQDPNSCLTAAQADAIASVYAPLRDPATGKVVFAGTTRGSEMEWIRWGYNAVLQPHAVNTYRLGFVDPTWDPATWNLSTDYPKLDAMFAIGDAIDPDLKEFRKSGGKLIQFMGWQDGVTMPGWTVQYYDMVEDRTGRGNAEKELTDTQSFYRLYMMPNVGHCGTGPGAALTRFDLVTALEAWVERGVAPEAIKAINAAGTLERPVCPYPQEPVYDGFGDITKATSFSCKMPLNRIRESAIDVERPIKFKEGKHDD